MLESQNNQLRERDKYFRDSGWMNGPPARGTAGTVDIPFDLFSFFGRKYPRKAAVEFRAAGRELPRCRMPACKAIRSHPANWTAGFLRYTRKSAFPRIFVSDRMNQRSTTTTSSGDKRSGAFLSRWRLTRRGRKRRRMRVAEVLSQWMDEEIGVLYLFSQDARVRTHFPGILRKHDFIRVRISPLFSSSLGDVCCPQTVCARIEFEMARLIL